MGPEMVRVFHCDDSSSYRHLLREQLRDDDVIEIVGGAGDTAAAIDGVADTQPDVVLLDLVAPGVVDGFTARLRAVAPGARVVVLSGMSRESRDSISAAGAAAGFVEKRATLDELRDAIVRVARG
jgi:DNA-binding NarL/FixJ family response regulator